MKRVKVFYLNTILYITYFCIGCSINDLGRSDESVKDGKVAIKIDVKKTYTTDHGLPAESKINRIDIVVLNEDGTLCRYVPNVEMNLETMSSKVLTLPVGRKEIIVIANAPASLIGYLETLDRQDLVASPFEFYVLSVNLKSELKSFMSLTDNDNGSFLMTNEDPFIKYDIVYNSTEASALSNPISIRIQRIASKVTVGTKNIVGGLLTKGKIEGVDVQLDVLSKNTRLFAYSKNGNPIDWNYEVTMPSGNEPDLHYMRVLDWSDCISLTTTNNFQNSESSAPLYCFENMNTPLEQVENKTTHLTVRLKFTPTGLNSGTFYLGTDGNFYNSDPGNGALKFEGGYMYYRIFFKNDITSNNLRYAVIRNNWYKVNIVNIKDIGDPVAKNPTSGNVTEESKLTVSVDIMPWNLVEDDVTM